MRLLRLALSTVYLWFGGLKLAGASPVSDMVAKTLNPIPKRISVPLVGIWESAVGAGLLLRRGLPVTLGFMVLQILGTFTFAVRRPEEVFQSKKNPLRLTQHGEFLLKNVVLLAAAIALGLEQRRHAAEAPSRHSRDRRVVGASGNPRADSGT